jgi:hypothetical protein
VFNDFACGAKSRRGPPAGGQACGGMLFRVFFVFFLQKFKKRTGGGQSRRRAGTQALSSHSSFNLSSCVRGAADLIKKQEVISLDPVFLSGWVHGKNRSVYRPAEFLVHSQNHNGPVDIS